LSFAVEEAYRGLLPAGRFPIAVVDVRVPPEEVDVNVHPAKAEVRLRDERAIFALIQRPLRRELARLGPSAGFGAPPSAWPGAAAWSSAAAAAPLRHEPPAPYEGGDAPEDLDLRPSPFQVMLPRTAPHAFEAPSATGQRSLPGRLP